LFFPFIGNDLKILPVAHCLSSSSLETTEQRIEMPITHQAIPSFK
jgi:hypothetical protein